MKSILPSNKLSRKEFIRISWMIVLISFFWIWHRLVKQQESTTPGIEEIKLPGHLPQGFTFSGNVIAVKDAENILFLSSRCTHLGCQIRSAENNELVCPCHGSRFGMDGRNLMGPATLPLAKLTYRIEQKTGRFIVKVPTG